MVLNRLAQDHSYFVLKAELFEARSRRAVNSRLTWIVTHRRIIREAESMSRCARGSRRMRLREAALASGVLKTMLRFGNSAR